jgi:uncharacterized protein (DUF58 family)
MIPVPTRRLMLAVLAVAVLALLGAAMPAASSVWLVGGALVGLVAVLDLVWSRRTVTPPRVTVPPILRLAKDRPGHLDVVFHRQADTPGRIRFGLALPSALESEETEAEIELPAGMERSQVAWPVVARQRGNCSGVQVGCRMSSRWGWWDLQARWQLALEIRVYPNLMTERKALATLFLPRSQFGARLQRTVGRGREFEKLREYLPGDGFDEVHWKATAKRGLPITKVFQAERTQEIYVVVDASRLSARPVRHEGREQTVLERYLTAALVLLLAAEQQGDRFGLVVFGPGVDLFLRASRGRAHYAACREAMYGLQSFPGSPDAAEIVRALRTRLRQRALLFVLTDLTDPVWAEDLTRHMGALSRQHLVLINQVRPPQVQRFFAGEAVESEAEVRQRLAGHLRWTELRSTARELQARGATTHLLEDEALAARLVHQYLDVKRRQAL